MTHPFSLRQGRQIKKSENFCNRILICWKWQ